MVIRQKILPPSKVAPRLVYMDDQKVIENELDKEVTNVLEELSKPQTYDDATQDEVQEERNKALKLLKPAAETKYRRVGKFTVTSPAAHPPKRVRHGSPAVSVRSMESLTDPAAASTVLSGARKWERRKCC